MVLVVLVGRRGGSVSHVSERQMDGKLRLVRSPISYSKSVSQADNKDNKLKIYTDTLALESDDDPLKTIKHYECENECELSENCRI